MRWIFAALAVVVVAWTLFMISPFVGLYRLARAIEARDVAAVEARVDVPELRGSLIRQLIDGYLKEAHKGRVEGFDRQLAAQAGAALADPVVAQLVTPQAIIDLLDDGWPQGVVALAPGRAAGGGGKGPLRSDFDSIGRALRLYMTSETRGFRKVYIALPHDRPPRERFRLLMRLVGGTWQLTGVDLPASLLRGLVAKLPRTPSAALH